MNSQSDATVIRPQPGGVVPASPTGAAAPGVTLLPEDLSAINPIVRAAGVLLGLVVELRHAEVDAEMDALRNRLIDEVRRFESRVQAHSQRPEVATAARYCMCAMVDEAVLKTSWGSASEWSSSSLLSTFHNETWGGEKFFLILDRLRQEPARHVELLELIYVCLRLGFQGRYLVLDNGHARLEALVDEVYRTIRHQRGDHERELSPHWRGESDPRPRVAQFVPLWVVGAVAGALLLVTFLSFRFALHQGSEPLLRSLQQIGTPTAVSRDVGA